MLSIPANNYYMAPFNTFKHRNMDTNHWKIDFVQSFARDHMQTRVARCTSPGSKCFPLSWTLSPNLIKFSPEILRWYFAQGAKTGGHDWFIMPPSGTLYAYPGEMSADVQAAYVQQQTEQATIMDTRGSVHWEWIFSWPAAWSRCVRQ